MHTVGAADTIDRVIDVFPPSQQQQVRVQLSMLLHAVISQQLIPAADDSALVPAFEIMRNNTAIRTMIREGKEHQIDSAIASGAAAGMISMDAFLLRLVEERKISRESALYYASNGDLMTRRLGAA
jgi:twitching motility protein PilT